MTEPGGEPRVAVTRDNGQVQLTLTGKQGSRYAIETSTALSNWVSAKLTVTVTNQNGAVMPKPAGVINYNLWMAGGTFTRPALKNE